MKAQYQRRLRQYHNWVGLFFAPAITFFALTGTAQILGLHEDGPGYIAPAWIKPLANIHKHGELAHTAKPELAAPAVEEHRLSAPQPERPGYARIFIALLGILLTASTALGIGIAILNKAARKSTILLLVGGVLVPIILLFTY